MGTPNVTSLEWSKKLKEEGVTQESEFYLVRRFLGEQYGWGDWKIELGIPGGVPEEVEYISAFLATELLEILPNLDILKKLDDFYSVFHPVTDYITCDRNLCDALAAMVGYLKENNLLK